VETARGALQEAEAAERQARAGISEAEAGLNQARAAQREAEALAEQARLNFQRAENLLQADSLVKPDYDSARAADQQARAKVDQAKAQVRMADSKVAQARAAAQGAAGRVQQARGQLDSSLARGDRARAGILAADADVQGAAAGVEQADIALGDATLKAPMDGVVLTRAVEIGTLVGPGTPGFEIANTRDVRVTFGVPDLEVARLKLGQAVTIGTESLPGETFQGRITTIYPEADPQSRVFRVEVKVSNPDEKLKVGMIAGLNLSEGPAEDVLTIPLAAVVRPPGQQDRFAVYVLEETGGKSVARLREVQLGDPVGDRMVVLSGLEAGEKVISAGSTLISDGESVRVEP
ncbi:MAG: efflux RND transporter periplasmic adaptor subunit, partial [Candidatus Eremiobacterota bacterium]